MATNSILNAILALWTVVMQWFGNAFDNLIPIFYSADTGLTFIGILAVAGTAVSVCFLFLGLIQKWLNFGR